MGSKKRKKVNSKNPQKIINKNNQGALLAPRERGRECAKEKKKERRKFDKEKMPDDISPFPLAGPFSPAECPFLLHESKAEML